MTEALDPNETLEAAVAALRRGSPPIDGLAARTRARATRQRRQRAWMTGSTGVLGTVALTLVLVRGDTPAPGEITFALIAPTSAGVSLVGDFNDWDTARTPLERDGDDEWRVTLDLEPGRYRFAYVTDDGTWLADPEAAPTVDEFGAPTSVVTVPGE